MLLKIVLCACVLLELSLWIDSLKKNTIHKHKLSGSHNLLEDAHLKVPELVQKYGYPLEVHNVTTRDGYILTMHRIPHGKDHYNQPNPNKDVVFLMHGIISSSADFVLMGPGFGLAYLLAEEGFDVWLGNARGNYYSRQHVNFKPDTIFNADFWQYSFDEIGNIDLPTMIDYALQITQKQRLHYIGFSQGTTVFFVMCSMLPEYNMKIKSMNALAPVGYLKHSGSLLLKAIAPFASSIDKLANLISIGEFHHTNLALSLDSKRLCKHRPVDQTACRNIMYLISGWNLHRYNATMVSLILGHTPAGTSVRLLAHYAQSLFHGGFQRYNHGWWKNKLVYSTMHPPSYNLTKVRAPTFLHYAQADTLSRVKDVERLWGGIGSPVAKFLIPINDFGHMDFVWGSNAKMLVYDEVIKIIHRMKNAAPATLA